MELTMFSKIHRPSGRLKGWHLHSPNIGIGHTKGERCQHLGTLPYGTQFHTPNLAFGCRIQASNFNV